MFHWVLTPLNLEPTIGKSLFFAFIILLTNSSLMSSSQALRSTRWTVRMFLDKQAESSYSSACCTVLYTSRNGSATCVAQCARHTHRQPPQHTCGSGMAATMCGQCRHPLPEEEVGGCHQEHHSRTQIWGSNLSDKGVCLILRVSTKLVQTEAHEEAHNCEHVSSCLYKAAGHTNEHVK